MLEWDERVRLLWAGCDKQPPEAFLAVMEELAAELDAGDPRGPYQRACALDYLGREAEAEPLYRRALAGGLDDVNRLDGLRCRLQLASTLRNLGHTQDALETLATIDANTLSPEHRDWLDAFLALCLTSEGRHRDAARTALLALSRHLTEYTESIPRYANEL